mgnify:CR=1 FL=1
MLRGAERHGIVAQQGIIQLQRFGAQSFVVNLIGNDGVKPSYWEICPGAANAAGQNLAIIVLVVAACEVTVGLGVIVAMYRRRLPVDVDELRELHG